MEALRFDSLAIVRPPMLARENTNRFGEKVMLRVLKIFNTLGFFIDMKPVTDALVADFLQKISHENIPGNIIYTKNDLYNFEKINSKRKRPVVK